MIHLRTPPLALAGLALLAGLNGSLVVAMVEATTSEDVSSGEKVEWSARLPELKLGVPSTPQRSHNEILAHPIFYKSRAPYVPPPPAPAKPVAAPPVAFVDPGFILSGILISGHTKKAYLSTKSNSNGTWVDQGSDFAGWKLQSITTGAATLNKEAHTVEVHLYPEQ